MIGSEIMADLATDALQRMGTREAIGGLQAATKDRRLTVVELAHQALLVLQSRRPSRQSGA